MQSNASLCKESCNWKDTCRNHCGRMRKFVSSLERAKQLINLIKRPESLHELDFRVKIGATWLPCKGPRLSWTSRIIKQAMVTLHLQTMLPQAVSVQASAQGTGLHRTKPVHLRTSSASSSCSVLREFSDVQMHEQQMHRAVRTMHRLHVALGWIAALDSKPGDALHHLRQWAVRW